MVVGRIASLGKSCWGQFASAGSYLFLGSISALAFSSAGAITFVWMDQFVWIIVPAYFEDPRVPFEMFKHAVFGC